MKLLGYKESDLPAVNAFKDYLLHEQKDLLEANNLTATFERKGLSREFTIAWIDTAKIRDGEPTVTHDDAQEAGPASQTAPTEAPQDETTADEPSVVEEAAETVLGADDAPEGEDFPELEPKQRAVLRLAAENQLEEKAKQLKKLNRELEAMEKGKVAASPERIADRQGGIAILKEEIADLEAELKRYDELDEQGNQPPA